MKLRLFRALQCLAILTFPLWSQGRENLLSPTVISNPRLMDDQSRCQIINVFSYTLVNNQVYAQVGVGWVIQTATAFQILTPSHVVAGAHLVTGQCAGRTFPLALKSKSETLDLALLDIVAKTNPNLFPVISTEDRGDFIKSLPSNAKNMANSTILDHSSAALKKAMSVQDSNFYFVPAATYGNTQKIEAIDLLNTGFAHIEKGIPSLFVESLAIRPGFSGSPFYITAGYDRPYLAGMLTKVEVNGSRSLGVSLPEILKALPQMMKSSDIDSNRSIRLRYSQKVVGKTLERKQELVQTLSDGSQRVYSEICNDSTAESSEWSTQGEPQAQTKETLKSLSLDPQKVKSIKQDDLEKSILDLKRSKLGSTQENSRGGDYGEGGGSLYALKNATFMLPVRRGDYTRDGNLNSYKVSKVCAQPMVKDQSSKIFDSISMGGRVIKTTSLNELYNALTSASLGQNTCVNKNISFEEKDYPTPYSRNGEFVYYTRIEGETQADSSDQYISCSGDSTRVRFYGSAIFVDANFSRSGASSGEIKIKNAAGQICQVQLSPKNTRALGSWKQQIRSKDLDVDVSFGSDDRAMSFKILKASDACNPIHEGKLWMYEINFSDTLAKLKNALGA